MTRINRNMLAQAFPDQPRMIKAFEELDKALDDAGLKVVDLEAAIAAAVAEAGDIPAQLAGKQAKNVFLTALSQMVPGAGVVEMAGANQFAIRQVGVADSASLVTKAQLDAVGGGGALDQQLIDLAALSYAGNAGKVVKVNAGETAWELAADLTGGGGASGYTTVNRAAGYTETATSGDLVIFAAGAFTIVLPSAVGNTATLTIKVTATGPVVLDGAGAETVDGSLTASIPLGGSLTLRSDNANWWVM